MARALVLLSLMLSLAGCGVAETGVAAAAAAADARQAKQTEDRVRQQLDAAMKQEHQHVDEAATP